MTTTDTAPATTSYRIEGVATLLSSLTHGGDHAGTTGFLRREKIVTADGTSVTEVPVVSGNALRGILRDHAAEVFWEALGRPRLPLPVFHLLWSGGALAKAGAGHVLGARQLQDIRRLIPLVSVFGGSGAGKIIEGKLRVGKLTPICKETAHLLPDGVTPPDDERPLPSMWDMLQIEEFTRRDDAKRDRLHHAVEGFTPAPLPSTTADEGKLLDVADHAPAIEDEAADGPAQQMRYGVETLAAGARLHWWMTLDRVTRVETALVAAAVESWLTSGGAIGGRSATGHGRLRLDVHAWQHQTPTVTVGQALDVRGRDDLVDHCTEHHDDILTALGWFA